MKVNFNVGSLTIHGGARAAGLQVAQALRRSLTELAASGSPMRALQIERLDAGTLPPGADAEHTGRHLANQIYRTLRGSRNA